MRRVRHIALLFIIGQLAFIQPKAAAEDKSKLPRDYVAKVLEATHAYNLKDYDLAAAKVEEAEKILPHTALLANFRGAIALDRKQYDKAGEYFDEASKIDPSFWQARYNSVEIYFRQGRLEESRAKYETLLAQNPKNKLLGELLQYRIFLTYLLEKNLPDAEATMNKLPFPGDSPAYYYAHAVWEGTRGNKKQGEEFMKGAAWVFPPQARRPFIEPLSVLGEERKESLGKTAAGKHAKIQFDVDAEQGGGNRPQKSEEAEGSNNPVMPGGLPSN
jgi:tetratricopeptide (TPR) repeat protein